MSRPVLSEDRTRAIARALKTITGPGALREVLAAIDKHTYGASKESGKWLSPEQRNAALVNEADCLRDIRAIVAAARAAASGPRPDLDILEHILALPLQAKFGHDVSARILALADTALALYRLDAARE